MALNTQPDLSRYVFYKMLTFIPVSIAFVAIIRYSSGFLWPLVYALLLIGHAAVMYSIKCPHCAYYKRNGRTLKCFMWWGVPKLYKPRQGPEKKYVGVYAPIGMLILTLYPIYWLRYEWELLMVFILSIAVVILSIGQTECSRCLNFECSHNTVPEDLQKEYRRLIDLIN